MDRGGARSHHGAGPSDVLISAQEAMRRRARHYRIARDIWEFFFFHLSSFSSSVLYLLLLTSVLGHTSSPTASLPAGCAEGRPTLPQVGAADCDVIVRVSDVYPDGRSILIAVDPTALGTGRGSFLFHLVSPPFAVPGYASFFCVLSILFVVDPTALGSFFSVCALSAVQLLLFSTALPQGRVRFTCGSTVRSRVVPLRLFHLPFNFMFHCRLTAPHYNAPPPCSPSSALSAPRRTATAGPPSAAGSTSCRCRRSPPATRARSASGSAG